MIYACEHHDEVLALWRRQGLTGIRLAHVDFHDDLRGLLVDRRRCCAYAIGALARGEDPADAGNFLAHAVVEGRVERVRWVHGPVGGRAWDAGIVRYESDLFAWPHRLRHAIRGGREIPLDFEETLIDDWPGVEPGERLSIDWDCFASILQDAEGMGERVASFVERLGTRAPSDTYVVYSPEYSRPSLDAFNALLGELTRRFGGPVEWLSPGLARGELHPSGVEARPPRGPLMRLVLFLRRHGVY